MMCVAHLCCTLPDVVIDAIAITITVLQGYANFDKGAARKFIIDPHGAVRKHLGIKAHAFDASHGADCSCHN